MRHRDPDVETLFDLVRVGDRVAIVDRLGDPRLGPPAPVAAAPWRTDAIVVRMDLRPRLAADLLALACLSGAAIGAARAVAAATEAVADEPGRGRVARWRRALAGLDGLSQVDAALAPARGLVPPSARVGALGEIDARPGTGDGLRYHVARYALAPREVVLSADAPFVLLFGDAAPAPAGFERAADLGPGLRLYRRGP